ncbi:4970_t:CDS:2 [Dentiscutata heterogama]|uniref:4970_t:CDS:1 n=1 Tax=Dentiscutata heterogama TaxID=1316150 RepID=A0ACA9M5B6_9GLOM|nr:4970_t:CDS:2 [Dentiscutata heterogama]
MNVQNILKEFAKAFRNVATGVVQIGKQLPINRRDTNSSPQPSTTEVCVLDSAEEIEIFRIMADNSFPEEFDEGDPHWMDRSSDVKEDEVWGNYWNEEEITNYTIAPGSIATID